SPPHNLHPLHSLFEPSQLARYVATYFSGIWLIFGINPARLIAAASVIWASITYLRKVCSRIQPSNSEVVLLSLGMFVIASAGITAIGRVNFGMEQAFASRYQTFALLYWLSVAALCLHFGWARRSTNVRFVMFQVLLLVMVVANDIYARKWVTEARSHSALTRSAGAALAVGVSDTKLLQRL